MALLGAGLILTGCAGAAEPTPAVTVIVTETATPAPEPSVEEEGPLALGAVAEFAGFSLVVHAVNLDPAPEPAPQPERAEDKWASADVEYCTTPESSITSYWWRMSAADNRQYEPSSVGYSAFPEPAYAWGEVPVAANSCHRGWITFTIGRDAAIEAVRYANDQGNSAEWAVQ